jgi:hypothetical protein
MRRRDARDAQRMTRRSVLANAFARIAGAVV